MTEPADEDGRWLTYSEAARVTGELPDKLRAMVRREKLKATRPDQNNDRKARVFIPHDMMKHGQGDDLADGQGVDHADGQGEGLAVAMLREELAEARERLGHAEGRAATLAEQIVGMAAGMAKAEARADRLEAELAEARKPLLVRLVEALRRR